MATKVHIGSEIKRVLESKGITPEHLAKEINSSRRNVYDILTREEVSTGQLYEIGKVLGFDFFSIYSTVKNQVQEPSVRRKTVAVTVVLDGLQTTLNEWVSMLEKVNSAL